MKKNLRLLVFFVIVFASCKSLKSSDKESPVPLSFFSEVLLERCYHIQRLTTIVNYLCKQGYTNDFDSYLCEHQEEVLNIVEDSFVRSALVAMGWEKNFTPFEKLWNRFNNLQKLGDTVFAHDFVCLVYLILHKSNTHNKGHTFLPFTDFFLLSSSQALAQLDFCTRGRGKELEEAFFPAVPSYLIVFRYYLLQRLERFFDVLDCLKHTPLFIFQEKKQQTEKIVSLFNSEIIKKIYYQIKEKQTMAPVFYGINLLESFKYIDNETVQNDLLRLFLLLVQALRGSYEKNTGEVDSVASALQIHSLSGEDLLNQIDEGVEVLDTLSKIKKQSTFLNRIVSYIKGLL